MASKKNNWFKRLIKQLIKNFQIVSGPDEDFEEDVKIGIKTKGEF
jgi:hypothetical protein